MDMVSVDLFLLHFPFGLTTYCFDRAMAAFCFLLGVASAFNVQPAGSKVEPLFAQKD